MCALRGPPARPRALVLRPGVPEGEARRPDPREGRRGADLEHRAGDRLASHRSLCCLVSTEEKMMAKNEKYYTYVYNYSQERA